MSNLHKCPISSVQWLRDSDTAFLPFMWHSEVELRKDWPIQAVSAPLSWVVPGIQSLVLLVGNLARYSEEEKETMSLVLQSSSSTLRQTLRGKRSLWSQPSRKKMCVFKPWEISTKLYLKSPANIFKTSPMWHNCYQEHVLISLLKS